jgi:hypothetical protein
MAAPSALSVPTESRRDFGDLHLFHSGARALPACPQAEYGSRDLHGGWNAGPGTRLDRSRTIAAALTGALD